MKCFFPFRYAIVVVAIVFVLSLSVFISQTSTGTGEHEQFIVDCMLVTIPVDDVAGISAFCLDGDGNQIKLTQLQKNIGFEIIKMQIAEIIFDFGRSKLIASNSDGSSSAIDSLVIDRPHFVIDGSDMAEIRHVLNDIQYLHKDRSGQYLLQELRGDESPGMIMKIGIGSGGLGAAEIGGDFIELDFAITIKFMTGRSPLTGVALEVGKPIIAERRVHDEIRVALDRWRLLSVHLFRGEGKNGNYLLNIVKISKLSRGD
jgi:hypothetical protein